MPSPADQTQRRTPSMRTAGSCPSPWAACGLSQATAASSPLLRQHLLKGVNGSQEPFSGGIQRSSISEHSLDGLKPPQQERQRTAHAAQIRLGPQPEDVAIHCQAQRCESPNGSPG